MSSQYYTIITNRGKELETGSTVNGTTIKLKDFVVGDGSGSAVTPDPARTTLVNKVYQGTISKMEVSPDQSNQFIAYLVLPADVGGFVVREVGLLTETGELYAVGNCAAIEKPVSGVNVTLQFRLAVSETADITLIVSTGDGLFLRQDANLSDVKDSAKSRDNLGLKGAAVLDVGTVQGTVAAGDDDRIVNALQSGKNLSDVKDKSKVRDNLGLGSAATRNVTDNATGDLMPVGYKGNFISECNHGDIDFATYPFVVGEALFINLSTCTNVPAFLAKDYYYMEVIAATNPSQGARYNRPLIQFVRYSSSTAVYAIREDDGTAVGWRYFKTVQYDAGSNNVSIQGNLSAQGSVTADYITSSGDLRSERNISSAGLIQAGSGLYDTPGVRVYSPNNPPDLNAYATKIWVDNKFVSSARRGGQAFQPGSGSGQGMAYEAPAGCYMTGINTNVSDGRGMGVYYRAFQVYYPNVGYVQIGD